MASSATVSKVCPEERSRLQEALREVTRKLEMEAAGAMEAREALGEAEVEWSTHLEGLRASLGESRREVARLDGLTVALCEEKEGVRAALEAAEERHKVELAPLQVCPEILNLRS